MSAASARNAFIVFAAAMGLSMSAIFVIYTAGSIGRVFFETAAAFGALSLYGYTTKRDLTAVGSFMVMGLFGIIIASIVNIFLGSNTLQWTLSVLAIGIFAGLTAWNTQSIKAQYYAGYGAEMLQKASIFGALSLYLDFVNIFQALLSLTGNQRSN
jgi:FtsH-binding integral membrane protein